MYLAAIACPEPACGEPVEPVEWAVHFGREKAARLMELFANRERLEAMPVHAFVSHFAK
jgi:hypothetical protein